MLNILEILYHFKRGKEVRPKSMSPSFAVTVQEDIVSYYSKGHAGNSRYHHHLRFVVPQCESPIQSEN